MEFFDFYKDIGDFFNGKAVVNCRTEENAKDFFNLLTSMYDIKWNYGDVIEENTKWEKYGEETCYQILSDRVSLVHNNVRSYKKYKVITYKSKSDTSKDLEIKTGDNRKITILD